MRAQLAVLRILATTLKASGTGLVARVPLVPRIAGDPAPRVPTAILVQPDDLTDVRERPSTGWPVVLVLEDQRGGELDAEAGMGYRDSTIRVVIVVVDEPAAQAEGYRTARYILQAVADVLERELLSPSKLATAGVLDGIEILQATRASSGALYQEMGVGVATAALSYEFQTRDTQP